MWRQGAATNKKGLPVYQHRQALHHQPFKEKGSPMAKNITKGAQVKSATTDSAAEIAKHISAIFNHSGTPVNVYNALADGVQDLYAPEGYHHSVEYLTVHLANHVRKGNEKTVAPPATATDAR